MEGAVTRDRALEDIGDGLAVLAAIGAFLAAWAYCAVQYGFLLGFGFGWLPATILAGIIAALTRWLWPLAAIAGILLAVLALGALLGWA